MKQSHIGLLLMVSSYVTWRLATSMLFDYIVDVLHPDQAFGEPIWVDSSYMSGVPIKSITVHCKLDKLDIKMSAQERHWVLIV